MVQFIPFQARHLLELDIQPAQYEWAARVLRPGYADNLESAGPAWTGVLDGKVVGCAGIMPQWEGYAIVWAYFGMLPPRHWPRVVRFIRKTLDAAGTRRLEANVVVGHGAACRLVNLLGFEIEGARKAFSPDGNDCFLYGRVAP